MADEIPSIPHGLREARQDDTNSWQGTADVGVRVCLKMCRQFGLEFGDLAVQLDDDADRGTVGGGETRR
jgi:hypothetical protein